MIAVILLAALLAVLIPVTVIAIRHEVRLRRIRLIESLRENLHIDGQDQDARLHAEDEIASFEFVKSKYAVDLDPPPSPISAEALRKLDFAKEPRLEGYLASLGWWELRSNWAIIRAAIPYMLVCTVGFTAVGLLFLEPRILQVCLDPAGICAPEAQRSLRIDTASLSFRVFAAAFLGAFLFTIRVFVQAVAVFDLSAVTLARASLHIPLNTIAASLAYAAVVGLSDVDPGSPLTDTTTLLLRPEMWAAAAFAFGFVPDAGLLYLISKASRFIGFVKTTDQRFAQEIRSTSLDVVEGIDFYIRFRLEEANINEVQGLACANPLMLFIETPYGLYQTVDWVAQAQLCTVVGLERFLILRQVNIRTIFDLERIVLSRDTTPALQKLVGGIMLAETSEAQELAKRGGKAFSTMRLAAAERTEFGPFAAAAAMAVASDLDAQGRNPSLEHLVRVILDDLHVHRLRQIWLKIGDRIGRNSAQLEDTRELRPPNAAP